MIMKKCFSVALIIFLIGCSNVSSGSQPEVATKTPLASDSTSFIEDTITPTQTIHTSTPSITQIPVETFDGSVKQECLSISADVVPLQEVAATGTVVVYDATATAAYIFDLETKTRYALPLKNPIRTSLPSIHVSPKGDYIAYVEDIQNDAGDIISQNVWVVDSKGVALTSKSINPEVLFTEWRWLDNDRLEFSFRSATPKDGTVAIFYPFKNEWQYLSNALPNFYKYFDLNPSWWLVDYNSNLDRVIYLGEIEEFVVGPILWDVDSREVIWEAAEPDANVKIPRWSPSGDIVAVIKEGSLYLINHDGTTISAPSLGDDSEIMDMTWSPDGNYIALLIRYNHPTIESYLMLYDVRHNQVLDYCLKNNNHSGVFPPIWSDNSQLIFYRLITMHNTGPQETPILVDIEKNRIYQVSEGIKPLVWMRSKPK